jgi:lipopolysaccharide transport system ATP-binding protein
MAIEFRQVSLGCLRALSASAPGGVVIGIIGANDGGQKDLLKAAGGAAVPESGEIIAGAERRYVAPLAPMDLSPADVVAIDHAYDIQDALGRARARLALDALRDSRATVFLASHEAAVIRTLCDEAWWIENGALAMRGHPSEVWTACMERAAERFRVEGPALVRPMSPVFRRGDGRAEIVCIETLGSDGKPTMVLRSGENASVRATVKYIAAVEDPVIGIMIRTRVGSEVYGTNTELEQLTLGPCEAGHTLRIEFDFRCDLCNNEYTLTLASHDRDGTAHDWVDDAVSFLVADSRYTAGVANLRAKVSVERLG